MSPVAAETCRLQCPYCLEVCTLNARFAGRRILCPMCDTAMKVPPPGQEPDVVGQDFEEALQKYKLSPWDRVCAQKAYDLEMVDAQTLRSAIRTVRRDARKRNPATVLEHLRETGALGKPQALAIAELAKGRGTDQPEDLVECPACFAAIPQTSKTCPYCGHAFADLVLQAMCPNCHSEQPPGRNFCGACGADMETGLRPGTETGPRCPRCSAPILAHARTCPRCRAKLDLYRERPAALRALSATKEWTTQHAFALFFAAGLVFLLYAASNWSTVRRTVNTWLSSPLRADLYERVRGLDRALEYSDLDGLSELIDPELDYGEPTEAARTRLLGGEQPDAVVQEVYKLAHREYDVDEDAGKATVYTVVSGRFDPDTVDAPAAEGEGVPLLDAAELMTGENPRLLDTEVAWKWVLREGTWYLAGPLPTAAEAPGQTPASVQPPDAAAAQPTSPVAPAVPALPGMEEMSPSGEAVKRLTDLLRTAPREQGEE